MAHKFPLKHSHQKNGSTFSEVSFISEIFQINKAKSRAPLTPDFKNKMYISKRYYVSLYRLHCIYIQFGILKFFL